MQTVHFFKPESITSKIEELFNYEREKLQIVFPDADTQHIGGTSVGGLISKGDLDINIRVSSEEFAGSIQLLKGLYEINQPNNWTAGFASFKDDSRDLGIQLTCKDSVDDHFVPQREFLKNHPEKVLELNNLKQMYEGKDMDEYRIAKAEFFKNLLT